MNGTGEFKKYYVLMTFAGNSIIKFLIIFVTFNMIIGYTLRNRQLCTKFSFNKAASTSTRTFRPHRAEKRSDLRASLNSVPDLNFKKTVRIDPEIKLPLSEVPFSEKTRTLLAGKGFSVLTPIQSQAYQYVFDGEDVVARSKTGTGKTLAFGIPLIESLVSKGLGGRKWVAPQIIILEPTRELAIQVAQELSYVCKPHGLKISSVFGGSSFSKQEDDFRNGVNIVVATPGRLLDHISRRTINLGDVQHIVLDEGDTMLEMGFQDDVESILMSVKVPSQSYRIASRQLEKDEAFDSSNEVNERKNDEIRDISNVSDPNPKKIQMLLFSATMPGWICKITERLMKNSIFLDAVQDGETRLASTISHFSLLLPGEMDRFDAVAAYAEDVILTHGGGGQTIIFTSTKEEADKLCSSRYFGHLKSQVLHGDISQTTRQRTLRQFRENEIDVLVATDVAARGLDIAGVDLVVHTAPPRDEDSYVHRSGRTGRAGRSGKSVLFYSRSESYQLKMLENKLLFSFKRVGPPSPEEISEASGLYVIKKLSSINDEMVKYFVPQAKNIVQNALNGSLWTSAVIDNENSAVPKSKDDLMEELLARCIISISQRKSITSRSLLTGQEGFMTLKIVGSFADGKNPQDLAGWFRFLKLFFTKMLKIERFQDVDQFDRHDVGKIIQAVDDKTGRVAVLVDVEHELANQILALSGPEQIAKHVNVEKCAVLPDKVFWGRLNLSDDRKRSSYSSSKYESRNNPRYNKNDKFQDRDKGKNYKMNNYRY